MTMTACLLIYLLSIRKVIVKTLLLLVTSAALFFFGFGYLGNQRSFNGDPVAFLSLTEASPSFVDSNIPKEYYWFYIYASSPFANFQNSTLTSKNHRYDILSFISWELLPDFLSKRIVPIEEDYDGKNRLDYSINPILTVGSIYFEPFIRLGWLGPIIVFCFYCMLLFLYAYFFDIRSDYFLTGISILCVISIFNIFENMINFSGLSLQLLYPILFTFIKKNFRLFIPSVNIIVPSTKFRILWRK
ncbi:hypothetical protein [Fibrella aestuarina]|nr:hypothetical protein [Fibrella aestuarina]